MKKYIFSFLLLSALAGIVIAPAVLAKENEVENKGKGWQMMSRPEVLGTVTAVSGNTITVKELRANTNTLYIVDATNAVIVKNGQASTVSNILVNDTVSVQGVVSGTNITATKINDGLLPKNADSKPELIGKVSAINGSILTVAKNGNMNADSPTYTVDATNAKITKNGSESSLKAIVPSDIIRVQGTFATNKKILATNINIGGSERELYNENNLNNPLVIGNGSPIIAGTVKTISGNTITISNKSNVTYTINATNAKVQSQGKPGTISNIAVNDNVVVQGTINGTSVTASLIIDQKQNTEKQINQNNDSQNKEKPKAENKPQGFFGRIGGWFKNLFGF